jgi:hypothetical protein
MHAAPVTLGTSLQEGIEEARIPGRSVPNYGRHPALEARMDVGNGKVQELACAGGLHRLPLDLTGLCVVHSLEESVGVDLIHLEVLAELLDGRTALDVDGQVASRHARGEDLDSLSPSVCLCAWCAAL